VWIERLRHRDVTKCMAFFPFLNSNAGHLRRLTTGRPTLLQLPSFSKDRLFTSHFPYQFFVSILALGALFCTNSSLSPVPKSGYLAKACRVSAEVEKEFLGSWIKLQAQNCCPYIRLDDTHVDVLKPRIDAFKLSIH